VPDQPEKQPKNGAEVVVRTLESHGVEYVFGIPGAKIDAVFNALVDSKIRTVVCRHEQNAAFIAGGIGRMTGKAGVAIATSGPGVSNLVTGLATANSEGDPLVALGGAVATDEALKQIRQTMDSVPKFVKKGDASHQQILDPHRQFPHANDCCVVDRRRDSGRRSWPTPRGAATRQCPPRVRAASGWHVQSDD
jgi:hypothetical protein